VKVVRSKAGARRETIRLADYPVRAIICIVIAIMVIYGLSAHYDEQTARTG
jgi:hypothetical protein